MGRPKIKIIDDSIEDIKEKRTSKSKKVTGVKSGADSRLSEADEVSTESNKLMTDEAGGVSSATAEAELEKQTQTNKEGSEKKAKIQKPGKAKPRSKKYQETLKDLDKTQAYSIPEAVELVKKLSYSKFTGTLETHINTKVSPLRGLVTLPFVSGKKLTILVFGKGAGESGADIIGTEELIEEINQGKINFDLVVTTPEWMPKLAKIARILGPRSLMPNPKNGTITTDLKKAVEGFQAGKTEYKTENKAHVIHLGLGKLDQPTQELTANITTLLQTLGKSRVKKVSISPTMGLSVKLDLSSI